MLLNHPRQKETHQAAPVRMENLDGTKVSLPIIIEVRKITQKVMTLWKRNSLQITNIIFFLIYFDRLTDNKHK